jgi:hypothetical protein
MRPKWKKTIRKKCIFEYPEVLLPSEGRPARRFTRTLFMISLTMVTAIG